jgi:hypothetical protein
MTRSSRRATTALVTFAFSALCWSGCGARNDAALTDPGKLAEARKARAASLKGEADGLIRTARRR